MIQPPIQLNDLLTELVTLNQQLSGGPADAARLSQVLERRAALIQQASTVIDQLRDATPQQREMLRQSENAGNALMRQLILAKHVLARELSQLKQEHRLWDAMAASEAQTRSNSLDVAG